MIGVIGSTDSVRLVLEVAKEMALTEGLVTRAYTGPEDAPRAALDIAQVCSVILFTGRVPYALARARLDQAMVSDYVPHSGVDLYRTLVVLLRRFDGKLPRLSIDTIDGDVVRENFDEIGLPAPEHIFDLEPVLAEGGTGTDAITAFHEQLFRDGAVDLCVTCLSGVRDRLEAAGVPVERVEHTHGAVRDSLRKATLSSQLQRSEAAQIAVVGVTGRPHTKVGDATLGDVVRGLAGPLNGAVTQSDGAMPLIVTTRGVVERELSVTGALGRELDRVASYEAWVGVGLGYSRAQAEEQVAYALTVSGATRDHHVVLPDGTVRRLADGTESQLRVRDMGEPLQAAARRSGVSPMTLAKLQMALASLGRRDVTAKELARAYGIETRSARRLLNALIKAGVATPLGAHSASRAGRPQVIYKINIEAMLGPAVGGMSDSEVPTSEGADTPHG
jgi:hypothetical protein